MMGRKEDVTPQQAQQALGVMDQDFNGRLTKLELFNAFREILMREGYLVTHQNANLGQNMTLNQQMGSYGQTNYTQYPTNAYNYTSYANNMAHLGPFPFSQFPDQRQGGPY